MLDEDRYVSQWRDRRHEKLARWRLWVRRLVVAGTVVVVTVGVIMVFYVRYRLSHVRTLRATVAASIVELSSHTDVKMQRLFMHAGERVEKGARLAQLDDSDLRAALTAAEAERDIRKSHHAQARTRAEGTEARVAADIALAEARVDIAAAGLERALALLALRRAAVPEEIRMAEATRAEAQADLERLKRGARREDIDAARARLAGARALAELCALEVKQSEELSVTGIDSVHTLQIKRTRLVSQQNAVREAQFGLDRLLAGATAEELEAARQRVAALGELKQAEADIERRRAELARMTLVSPVLGTVLKTLTHEGEIARKGEAVILVTNDQKGRWVDAFVREEDAEYVREGQSATIEIVGGRTVLAEVAAVGQSTFSMATGSREPDTGMYRFGALVWVKLRPVAEGFSPLPGSSASAVIRIR